MPEALTLQTRDALARAVALCERDYALRALAEILDPGHALTTWKLAGKVAARIRRFQSTAGRRIAAGYREPRDSLERALAVIVAAGCPQSARRIYDLLAELGF